MAHRGAAGRVSGLGGASEWPNRRRRAPGPKLGDDDDGGCSGPFWSRETSRRSREALPGSYFGLVRRLVEACPRLEVIKRSVCIEGARRALARAKVHWGKLDGEKLVRDGPPPGKEHRKPENYYKDVLAGDRLMADECTKDVIFE